MRVMYRAIRECFVNGRHRDAGEEFMEEEIKGGHKHLEVVEQGEPATIEFEVVSEPEAATPELKAAKAELPISAAKKIPAKKGGKKSKGEFPDL